MQSDSTRRSLVAALRGFNRFYTEAIRVLGDEHLGTGLTLGQARVLFEIGALDSVEVHDLRMHLDLDAGYLSRTLSALGNAGLISTMPSHRDRRVKRVTLTRCGKQKLGLLERRSEQAAARWLQRLDGDAQHRLVAAMDEIQRLLCQQVDIVPRPASSPEARACLAAYFAELAHRLPDGFDPTNTVPADPQETRPPRGRFLVVHSGGRPLGCGALKTIAPGVGEIKRMWIHRKLRGRGVGRRLLAALEACSAELGHHTIRLDTSDHLGEAVALYRSAGYEEIEPYNTNPYATHWFEKRIA
jgi:DNA-binding MarR family transcriptional regulator/GNAT superfamily N-acetyltransferase